ncbi:ribosome biogenesis GTPase Der [Mycoplasmoides pneumoniae]|uniref:GTPase Der n=4 Tax=Mycoplasmoides pneumoniae TaxID=2104 RepID=DER_MYCPN|nr:ribosome biogenesis GTPase Der [Mycoplasmoides pneumoniae]P75309.2 RecName: Full=GTPase Der; AltName: Full=GTP-binding protein EngA [Mycoplasmoides pneumoniae M129]AAG34744.1 GTPase [Mycoplasmoides pneumoniae M129]ADK87018.1 ribosome-associated GTPase EngA [Mycoplasmoides pneumoniae FH]AGC04368.1 GTP-binding protein Der [Mycoplasmoides pneumoniae M129-B7]ALA30348.1 GTP-binding protein Der [Mycoplasmoides pneumoniae PI 1428]ALA30636.1 GTP-binding protein Der [Mycoplasmoides pneumoniae 19294
MFTVAIIGRPNVGKSSLFNRLIQKPYAIISDTPNTTRDRIYGVGEWLTRQIAFIDTGGLISQKTPLQQQIEVQVRAALSQANAIIFLVSYQEQISSDDFYVAKVLKKIKDKPILLVVNKSENLKPDAYEPNLQQFYSFGFGQPVCVSASHGIGIGNLMDRLVKDNQLPPYHGSSETNPEVRFCVIGKPNVGKSSLINQLVQQNRVLVSDESGTTRDAIDIPLRVNGQNYLLIDTAGIRRKGKIAPGIEAASYGKTQLAIARSNIILLMVDGSKPLSEQDEIIGGLAQAALIPVIILVNKWDLVQKDSNTMAKFKKQLQSQFQHLSFAPIVFISVKNNKRLHTIFEQLQIIQEQLTKKISTSLLNDVIQQAQLFNQAPLFKGGRLQVTYAVQTHSQTPHFVLFCNDPKFVHFSYARFLENKIRESFGFSAVPITLYFKSKNARIRGVAKT